MYRFVIRNYGASKHLHYKGKSTLITRDAAIETNDADFIDAISHVEELHIVDHGPECGARLNPTTESVQIEGHVGFTDEDSDVEVPDENELENPEVDESENQEQEGIGVESYDDLRVPELKLIAEDRGIETKGLKKAEIVEALEKYDKEEFVRIDFEDDPDD